MSDLIVLGDSGASPYHTTEHYLRKVLVGDIKSVRVRLIAALERLDYDILDDDDHVVRGRRQARGWGTSYSSADVLDYPMTLIVKLKEQGEHATRATFDYVVKHPSLSKGEKEVLTREAEAISALATVRALDKICSACGIESTDDSRFCRRCGSKMVVESNELEILRMYSEIRAGHTSVVTTFIVSAASTVIMGSALLAMLLNGVVFGKGIAALLVIGMVLSFLSTVFVCFGWNRMNRSLKRSQNERELMGSSTSVLPFPDRSNQFELETPPASVTERTTNLLRVNADPAKTGEFGTD
ncbi:MAG: zinc ribbon domain-containing protein [Pyrinomonadaceae bacterium]|nr:zinc ribbon domain-containing protein [Acidobacteriota bacterium]MBP7376405.1 zinc ribbon domain-containing protein [Pyrinomonadaceae bacterium]